MASKFFHVISASGIAAMLAACGGSPGDSSTQPPPQTASPVATNTQSRILPASGNGGTPPLSSEANLGELRQQVTLLRREVRDQREQVARIPRTRDVAAIAPDPRTDPVARQEAQQTERMRIATSEAAFQGERGDGRWAQATTSAIQAALTQVDDAVRGQVRSIECRSTSCRVEINAGANDSLAQELPLVIAQLGQTLPHMTAGQIDQGDGRQATVLYLSR
jgi:hypothetical protein